MESTDDFCLDPVNIFSELTGLSKEEVKYIFKRSKELREDGKSQNQGEP